MDFPLSKVAVDWSLIDIWCCGKFHSSVDICDHTQLCHVKHNTSYKSSSPQKIRCRTLRSSLFGTSFLHKVEETPFPKSPEIEPILNREGKRKRKESQDGNNATRLPSPKRRHLSERKSKSKAEVELANTTRVDSLTPPPDISDLKNLFDDTNDIEGDRKNGMHIVDDKQDTFSDEVTLKKQQEAAKGRIMRTSKIKDEDNGGRIVKEGGLSAFLKEEDNCVKRSNTDAAIGGVGGNKKTGRKKRNTDNKKNEVKVRGKTSVNYPQKINIKKEKVSCTDKDNSEVPMIDIASDSDNDSVMFLQSYNMDFSCKVKGCHANFWFKSELDQHKTNIHNS